MTPLMLLLSPESPSFTGGHPPTLLTHSISYCSCTMPGRTCPPKQGQAAIVLQGNTHLECSSMASFQTVSLKYLNFSYVKYQQTKFSKRTKNKERGRCNYPKVLLLFKMWMRILKIYRCQWPAFEQCEQKHPLGRSPEADFDYKSFSPNHRSTCYHHSQCTSIRLETSKEKKNQIRPAFLWAVWRPPSAVSDSQCSQLS